MVSNRFWPMPHFGISKNSDADPVIFKTYIFKNLLQFMWKKLKKPLSWSLNKLHQNIACPALGITDLLVILDMNTWNRTTNYVSKLFELDRNTWYQITVCKKNSQETTTSKI